MAYDGFGGFRAQPRRRANNRQARKPALPVEPPPGRLGLTVNETAWLLGVSVNTVWNLLAQDALKSFRIGRRRLISRSVVEEFIARGGTTDE